MNVQCRKAAVRLSDSLKDWSTFVLLENSTYIKFIYPDNDKSQAPSTFYIIHMTSKPPCVIIWLAFPGGTSGSIRHSVVQDIKSMISKLTIKQLQSWRDISRPNGDDGFWIEETYLEEKAVTERQIFYCCE